MEKRMKQVMFGTLAAAALVVAARAYDASRHVRPAEAVLAQAAQAVAEQAVSGYETVALVAVRQVCEGDMLAEVEIAVTSRELFPAAEPKSAKTKVAIEGAIQRGCVFAGAKIKALNVRPRQAIEAWVEDGLETYARPAPFRNVRLVSLETPTPNGLQVQAEARAGWFRRVIRAEAAAEYAPVPQERIVARLVALAAEIEAAPAREVVLVDAPVPAEPAAGAGETDEAAAEPTAGAGETVAVKGAVQVQPQPAPDLGRAWLGPPADEPLFPGGGCDPCE